MTVRGEFWWPFAGRTHDRTRGILMAVYGEKPMAIDIREASPEGQMNLRGRTVLMPARCASFPRTPTHMVERERLDCALPIAIGAADLALPFASAAFGLYREAASVFTATLATVTDYDTFTPASGAFRHHSSSVVTL